MGSGEAYPEFSGKFQECNPEVAGVATRLPEEHVLPGIGRKVIKLRFRCLPSGTKLICKTLILRRLGWKAGQVPEIRRFVIFLQVTCFGYLN